MPTFEHQLTRLSITLHRYLGALTLMFAVGVALVATTTDLPQLLGWLAMVACVTAFGIILYVSERIDAMREALTAPRTPRPPSEPRRPQLRVVR